MESCNKFEKFGICTILRIPALISMYCCLYQVIGQPVKVHHAQTEPLASTSTSILSSVSAEMDTLD